MKVRLLISLAPPSIVYAPLKQRVNFYFPDCFVRYLLLSDKRQKWCRAIMMCVKGNSFFSPLRSPFRDSKMWENRRVNFVINKSLSSQDDQKCPNVESYPFANWCHHDELWLIRVERNVGWALWKRRNFFSKCETRLRMKHKTKSSEAQNLSQQVH